jgi:hypothetical protein
VADVTMLFDDLLRFANVRSRSYVVVEPAGTGLACVELSARRVEDWFFARRWVVVQQGRRLLYRLLDEIEGEGFHFRIRPVPRAVGTSDAPTPEPWALASVNWARLSAEERRIHRELFPQEETWLHDGYDWDHGRVYRSGVPLPLDAQGRCVEQVGTTVYEWVRIIDEWTWRRYPLYVLPTPIVDATTGPSASAGVPCT